MPPLVSDSGVSPDRPENTDPVPGQGIAIAAEALFLINLMIVPLGGFLALMWLYRRHIATAPPVARCHLRQTMSGSLWGGVLLVAANAAIIALGGYGAANTWVVVILYFTAVHSTLILLGALGLAKAMAGNKYVYPIIGWADDAR